MKFCLFICLFIGKPHQVIDQPASQMGGIHPASHIFVIIFTYQKRETEIVKQPFSSAFPVLLLLSYLYQFSGKRQIFFIQLKMGTQILADTDLEGMDIAFSSLQGGQLEFELIIHGFELSEFNLGIGAPVLYIRLSLV